MCLFQSISVFDSWGKLPSGMYDFASIFSAALGPISSSGIIKINRMWLGILRGDMYDLGDFDECLNIDEPNHFDPRYWYESK